MIFMIFVKFGVSGLHKPMQNSRHTEATDMKLTLVDSLYFRVQAKKMRNQNKLLDFEKYQKFNMKSILRSVSEKKTD